MAETGQYYDRHPVTGEPGRWRLFQDQGYVNFDPNPPKDLYWNPRGQNYIGELGQYYTVNPNTGEESIVTDPETGETRGGWYYSGTLGWLNTKPAEIQPDPGGITFGMNYLPDRQADTGASLQQPAGGDGATTDTTGTTQTTTDTTEGSFTPTVGSTVRGAFTAMTPQVPQYNPVQLPSVAPAPSVKNVDYVKLLRGRLVNSLFKDLI